MIKLNKNIRKTQKTGRKIQKNEEKQRGKEKEITLCIITSSTKNEMMKLVSTKDSMETIQKVKPRG